MISPTYSSRDLITWSLAGALAGLMVGLALEVAERFVVFLMILAVGVVWLTALRRSSAQSFSRATQREQFSSLPSSGDTAIDVLDVTHGFESKGILTASQAREWLDRFLQRQQSSGD
jgi:hypothetical protein